MAQKSPEKLLQIALKRYYERIQDYTCTFTKLERLGNRFGKEQVIDIKFRESPFSVMMYWVKNSDKAERVIFVKGENEDQAVVRPAGPLARLLVNSIRQSIDSPLARRASRRRIDQFGFANALMLSLKYYRHATDLGHKTSLSYGGMREINGRSAIKLVRRLPNLPEYPDQTLEIYLDKKWLLPTALVCRDEKGELLGRYTYTDVQINVGLSTDDFEPGSYGM
jgi:hypothetical protein